MEGETLYSYIIGMLRDLVVKESVYLQVFSPAIDDLQEKLTEMEELLEYADVRRNKCIKEIIGMADHLIDQKGFMGIKKRLLSQNVRLEIEKITSKLNEFLDSQSGDRDVDASASGSRRAYKVQDLSGFGFAEKGFVGREKDITKLVEYLVDEEKEEYRIISIHGMGGLGKTTLARKVYRDRKVSSHFKKFAFVCVSEQCQAEELLKHILQQLVPNEIEKIKDKGGEEVLEWLRRVVQEEKCLVIIDDIWLVRDWESLCRGLPIEFTGSKVLLTTRIKDVADKGFYYSLERLSEDEAWELFQKKIILGEGYLSRVPEEEQKMKEMGKEMITSCGGIPLAVEVLRGTLVTKGSFHEWLRFYNKREWKGELYENDGQLVKDLSFSYTDLPYPLKPCFLYLGIFAEDEEISVEQLYMLWDGEGLILSKDREAGETNIDVAKRYLGELVGRSMVEAKVTEILSNEWGSFKSCRLHDLMRALCLSIAKKENFMKVHNYSSHKDKVVILKSSSLANETKMPPRQAIYFYGHQKFEVDDGLIANRHIRSLMLINGYAKKPSNLKKLDLLRVLTISCANVSTKQVINELFHLRCLHLGSRISLRSSIDNLIYLQTLDLRETGISDMPNTFLWKLKRLRHLFLPNKRFHYYLTPKYSKLRIDGLTELETLVNIDSRKCEMNDVIQLTNLKRVVCNFDISSEDDGKMFKEFMEKVKLDASGYSLYRICVGSSNIEVYSDILRGQLLEYRKENIYEMDISGLIGNLLPEFSKYNLLIQLRLQFCTFEEDPMPILEKLSNLEELRLDCGKLKGKEMACSAMGFPKLKILGLNFVVIWEKWTVEEGALPNLYELSIMKCSDLKMLPSGLKFITTLEELYIRGMSEEFRKRLKGEGGEEGPDFHNIRHVRHVTIINYSESDDFQSAWDMMVYEFR